MSEALAQTVCRVCRSGTLVPIDRIHGRTFLRCDVCECVLVAPEDLPDAETEKAHYDRHGPQLNDPRQRAFVARVVGPLMTVLPLGASGLDYGCGIAPVGAAIMRRRGFRIVAYDPIFRPVNWALWGSYDFVLCSDVVEHFHDPADEFDRLGKLLRPGGWLGILRSFRTEDAFLGAWRFRRDPTRVAFYCDATLRHIAASRGWVIRRRRAGVTLVQTPAQTAAG